MARQLQLFATKRVRRGLRLGRKARLERKGFVPHCRRPVHDFHHPVHVTIRRVRLGPSFRTERVRGVILSELGRARTKGMRVVQYSLQDDHIHLMVEGESAADLSAQMRKLFSRIAMKVNQATQRHGSLFRDRHHRHALQTPREVRNALVYILFNARKHGSDPAEVQALRESADPFSSAPWFAHWSESARPSRPPNAHLPRAAPLVAPRTWLATVGWKRAGGPVRFDESPRRA